MSKKIVLKDNSENLVKVDLKTFIEHINRYHKTGTSIHDEKGYYFTVNDTFRRKLKKIAESYS